MGVDRLILKFRLRLLSWLYRSRSVVEVRVDDSEGNSNRSCLEGCYVSGYPRRIATLRAPPIGGPIAFVEQFSYKDIKKATQGFNRIVYSNAQVVAYKAKFRRGGVALVKEVKEFHDSNDVFFKEVQLLGRLHHRHILALRGFSIGRKRFLVCDGVQNGSLKEHLNDPLMTPLNWTTRLQIAIGVAAALEYLFIFSDPPVYHVSISTSSIMLDDAFAVKLSDVGLLSSSRNHASVPNSPLSEDNIEQECQNIIFQLGLLILELVTGQSSEKGCVDLVKWIQGSKVASSMQKMIDPDLGNNYNTKEARILLAVAKLCIESKKKPKFSISQVFRYLHRKVDMPRKLH